MNLTTSEFNNKRDQLLKLFARIWYDDMLSNIWVSPKKHKKCDAQLIWLFVYALDTYEHSSEADNYITEQQVAMIFKRVNSFQ